MNINADYSQRVVLNHHNLPWIPSPESGVERRMLDRIGDEVAKATSIVRYAPGSHFPTHIHEYGEEILVLDGVFSDETGDYPAGTYIMNPPALLMLHSANLAVRFLCLDDGTAKQDGPYR